MTFGSTDEAATDVQPPHHARVTGAFRVVVVEGPDRGAVLVVDGTQSNRVLVGQGQSCDLRLSDGTVSRRHAALDLRENGLRVVDLESRNGTFVSGVRVFDAMLEGGETLRVGNSVLHVEAVAAARAVPISSARSFGHVVGASIEMRRLYPLCERLAASDVPVVIEGQTGTGKEALAETIHDASARARGPFVVFDCTAVPPNLVESELFGHERGAFTGAVAQRKGVFEQAHGGTLLIDEIGDLDMALQPKLLRVIERSEVRRVGSSGPPIKVDVRLLAATRRDLDREVQDGRFRDDLYYRLAVARIELPPLRARKGDVAVLAAHFWREMGGKDDPPYELIRRFERYAWPGNVRELANAVARYIALGDFAPAGEGPSEPPSGDLVEGVLGLELPFPRARDRVLAEFERRYVARMLARHGGNVAQAAQASGIGRRYFAMIASRHAK
jgi:DNA-binding NtrC family response regulator